MTETLSINDLPLENFLDLLEYLDVSTLAKCRLVCKQWKDYIDGNDHIVWQKMCRREFKYSSVLAKEKACADCKWYHLYRNLKLWSKLMSFEAYIKQFGFSINDNNRVLNVDHGLLAVRSSRGIYLYDLSTLKYIHPAIPERNCYKIVNNDLVTVVQIRSGILLQRSVDTPDYTAEDFIKAEGFVLGHNMLYFHRNQDVFEVDLAVAVISPKFILHSEYSIKEITLDRALVYLYTYCGKIVTIKKNYSICIKPVDYPIEWVKDIKYTVDVEHEHYICYSKHLYRIVKYQSPNEEVLSITALCFYVDVVLMGLQSGEILLYRLSDQKKGSRPVYETIINLPKENFARQLFICERQKGPVIIATTFNALYILEFDFYPNEPKPNKSSISDLTIKRLRRLSERLRES